MTLFSAVFIYILIWWTMLFVVLPWGVRGQAEADDVYEGSEPGAPVNPRLKRKFLQTTLWSFGLWIIIAAVIHFQIITWDQLTSWVGAT